MTPEEMRGKAHEVDLEEAEGSNADLNCLELEFIFSRRDRWDIAAEVCARLDETNRKLDALLSVYRPPGMIPKDIIEKPPQSSSADEHRAREVEARHRLRPEL